MTVQNLAPFVANLINMQSIPQLSATLTDTNGGIHNVIAVPLPTQNSVTYIIVDPNVFNPPAFYIAVQVTISLGSTVIVQESINVPISFKSNMLAIQVTVNDGTNYNFAPVIQSLIVPVLMGITPTNYSVTLQWTYVLATSPVTTTSSGNICSPYVQTFTQATHTGGSASGSGNTLTISATIPYGSCQQIQNPTLAIIIINSGTGGIPVCQGCYTSVCGYNQSCNATVQLQVSL